MPSDGKEVTSAAPAVRWIEVGEDEAGQRIDNYLLARLKGVPKSHVYRILRSGEVRINSKRAEASQKVVAGDRIRIPRSAWPSATRRCRRRTSACRSSSRTTPWWRSTSRAGSRFTAAAAWPTA
jgi:hypothetical protein